jgi:hypothetical protein
MIASVPSDITASSAGPAKAIAGDISSNRRYRRYGGSSNTCFTALDRQKVRARFEKRFSSTRMARDYVKIYGELLASAKTTEDAGIRHLMPEHKNENRDRARIV